MLINKFIIITSLFMSILFLNACGSSGSDSNNPVPEGTTIGIIVDSQIEGLRYESVGLHGEKTSGVTNAKGEYKYFEGGTTTFFVGGIQLAKTTPQKMLSITTVAATTTEQDNIARFLQTLDVDNNPDNGIDIPSSITNATNVTDLKFDSSFDTDFENIKESLFQNPTTVSLVTTDQAIAHASKSERLSSLQETDLYKAIANEKNYSSTYYNGEVLTQDQRKRVYLWIWEKILAKKMAIENDLATQEFDINKVEEERDRYKMYIDYADSLVNISSLGKDAYGNLLKAGTRTMSYELTQLTSLTVSGCDAVVKLNNTETNDSISLASNDICTNMMKVLNPVNDSADKLAVANPILSSFLPSALPVIMKYKKMNWLHFDTKSLRALTKAPISKPNLVSIGIAIAGIVNDSAGAYRASNINKELTTRLIAQEWLSVWYRSGFSTAYMNKLINDNQTQLIGNRSQIEAIALKFGTSGALCDAYKFFNPFVDCSTIEHINYDYNKVVDITSSYLAEANALYKSFGDLTGPISDQEGNIGVIDINWSETLDKEPLLVDYKFDGDVNDSSSYKNNLPSNINVNYIDGVDAQAVNLSNKELESGALGDGDFSRGITISLWIKTDELKESSDGNSSNYGRAQPLSIIKNETTSSFVSELGIDFYYPSHSGWKFALSLQSGDGNHYEIYPSNEPAVQIDKWYHIVYTVDPNGIVRVWYNGVEGIGASISSPLFLKWSLKDYKLQVGSLFEGTDFVGAMDNLKIYNYALEASEVEKLK